MAIYELDEDTDYIIDENVHSVWIGMSGLGINICRHLTGVTIKIYDEIAEGDIALKDTVTVNFPIEEDEDVDGTTEDRLFE